MTRMTGHTRTLVLTVRDDAERAQRSAFLSDIANNFGAASKLYQKASADPSNDDYQ